MARTAGWFVLAALSAAATVAAWRAPTGYPAPEAPAPLPRARPGEREELEKIARSLAETLAALPPDLSAEEVEARITLPDNPLVPGRGGLAVACAPEEGPPDVDWVWCPQTRVVTPRGLAP